MSKTFGKMNQNRKQEGKYETLPQKDREGWPK